MQQSPSSTPHFRLASCPHSMVDSPPYSPPGDAPAYSVQLLPHERLLSYSPPLTQIQRMTAAPLPTGRFTQSYKHADVTLYNQPEGVARPVYGTRGVIKGGVTLKNNDSICSVCLSIQGTLEIFTGVSAKSQKIVNENYTLWAISDTATDNTCPTYLPFTTTLPSTFTPDDSSPDTRPVPLPPSLNLPPDLSRVSVKCEYRLLVTITQRVMFMTQTKYVPVPITYYPRDRPRRSMLSTSAPYLFSSIKKNPDEWTQLSSSIEPRPRSSNLGKIDCHFFIPSVENFAISESIPFHVQLSGPLFSVNELHFPYKEKSGTSLSPVSSNSHSSRQSCLSQIQLPPDPSKKRTFITDKASTVRVYILRQVLLCVNGRKATREVILGEGILRESEPESAPNYIHRPPGLESPRDGGSDAGSSCRGSLDIMSSSCSGSGEKSSIKGHLGPCIVDWEGEVQVYDKNSVISFDAGDLSFCDYMVLDAKPVRANGHFKEMMLKRPIKIVTDPWVEEHFNQITETANGTRNGTFT